MHSTKEKSYVCVYVNSEMCDYARKTYYACAAKLMHLSNLTQFSLSSIFTLHVLYNIYICTYPSNAVMSLIKIYISCNFFAQRNWRVTEYE